jgi:hypothetical protein
MGHEGHMRRREFIMLLGGAGAAGPLAARAQSAMPVIGFLRPSPPESVAHLLPAFRAGLKEIGFVENEDEHLGGVAKRERLQRDKSARRGRIAIRG